MVWRRRGLIFDIMLWFRVKFGNGLVLAASDENGDCGRWDSSARKKLIQRSAYDYSESAYLSIYPICLEYRRLSSSDYIVWQSIMELTCLVAYKVPALKGLEQRETHARRRQKDYRKAFIGLMSEAIKKHIGRVHRVVHVWKTEVLELPFEVTGRDHKKIRE